MTRDLAPPNPKRVPRDRPADDAQIRQAAELLERENERLLREVLSLKQQLNAANGQSFEQMQFLAELERQLAQPPHGIDAVRFAQK